MIIRLFSLLILLIGTSSAFASGAAVSYQGRIIQPDGSSLNSGNVQFRIQVRTPDSSNCLMYEENRTVSMAGSNGVFALSINGAGATRTDSAIYDFNRVFANKGTFTFPAGDCGTTNTYTPSGSAGRKVVAMFYANGAWEALPSMNVNFVPYAVESTTVGGYGSGDILRVDHLASEVVAPFTFADYGKLVDVIAGKLNGSVLPTLSSGQVLGSDGSGNWTAVTPLTAAGLPACATGEYLRVSSGALVCQAVAMTGGTITSITAGAGLTGGTITTSGTIALATVGSGGSGTKLTYDAYGRVTAGAALAESDIPTLSSAGKVNGSAITGTIGNGTAISTSGAIQTSTDLMAGRFYLYDGGGSNTIGFRAPATVVPYVLTYPAAQGTAGQTLVNDGSGQLTWTTPLASVSGFAPLANGKIWVGDASGKAQEVTMSGDGVLASNGSLSLNTVSVAKGGTGLSALGTANQILGVNPGATGLEYKSVVAGTGVTITPTAGTLTISAAGSGGTVTSVNVSVPSYMTSSGGPITSNGSIALGFSAQNANTVFAGPSSGSAAPGFRVLSISDIKSSVAGNFLQASGACAAGQTLTYSSVSDAINCAGYSLTSLQITTALGYTPVNKAGDAMTGALSLPPNGLSVGTTDLVTTATGVGVGTATPSTRLDVNGTLKVANGAEACSSAGNGGMIRYSGATLQYCNGSSWQTLGVAGAGLTSLNGQTGSTQTFAVGSTGTAPAFSSATNTHTLNLPMASGTGVTAGLLAKTDYDTFAAKQPAGSYVTALSGDVTSSGFTGGTVTTTIANNAVTNAKINDVGVDKITSAIGKYFTYAPNGAVCANGQILKWNFASSRWECAADAGITTETDPTVAAFAKNAPASDFTTPSGVLTLATVPVSKGGTGLVAAPTNGQLLIGNGTGYALGTITAGSGVNVANSAGGITITATGSGGTVTNVTGTAPIAVATGTSTPVVSIAKATAAVDGYLAATDFTTFNAKLGTTSTFAGDVSGTSSAMSVDKLKATPLLISTLTTGQYLKYNGTNWINTVIDAADIGTGTLPAARMPAHTGDVTSSAGSTALTLNTVTTAKGGTGLTSIGTANQILGVNPGATGLEYKSLTAGSGVSITPSAGTLTITATGSGGTVTNVTSANGDIAVATGTSTPVLTLNSGTAASQILKLDATAKIPAVDGSQLTGLNTSQFSTGTLPIARGGTNSATALNNSRLMTSVGGAIVELGAMTDGQLVVGKSAAVPQVVTLTGDATISNTGALSLNTVPVAKGGTGLTAAATNGQLLIGNGTGYTLGTITAGSGVNVANSAGGITITATGSGGTVTNVIGTAPIVVATGTSTPAVSIAKSTAAVDGYLAATDFATFNAKLGTASTFAGDVSGTSSAMSVDKLKATPLLITTLTTGQYLKYNGTNWINAVIDAADIGTGTLPAARMPAHTGDVTSTAGSTTLTLATVTPAKGGTGLTSIGTANQILGVNTGATGLEYRSLTAGSGVSITPSAGTLTITATGSGGTVTNVTGTAPIVVATGTSTPAVSIAKSTAAVDGYLAATDFATFNAKLGTASTFAGDVSGTSSTMSVDKLKATPLLITTLTTGQYLKYNGTNWINAVIDAADIGTGTLPAARMPAHTGDVTSSAGSTTLTLATVTPAKGGTGLTSIGTANQILGVNTGATGLEYKTLTAGTGVTITPAAGTLTINATGSGGTVTNVTSANADIAVATGSSTPLLTLNSGTGASQILKLNASSQIPAVDGSLLTNLNPASLSTAVPVAKGGTGVATLTSRGVLVGQGTAAVTSTVGAAGTVLQGNGASVDPSFTAVPVHGVNGTTTGTLGLANGAASGATITLAPSASTTAAYTFTLPATGGTNGYVLQTNGSGVTSWVAAAASGTVNTAAANQLAYYSGAGTSVSGLSSAANSVLLTNASSAPAWSLLTNDNFAQYALLAGRSGGQTIYGGSASGENLTLYSTANATKGNVLIAPTGGNVGIGTTSPAAKLEVAGGIRIGNMTTTCDATVEGSIRYNSTSKKIEYCNATAWGSVGVGAIANVSIGSPSSSLVKSGPVTFVVTYGSGTDTVTIHLASGDISFGGSANTGCSVTGITGSGLTRNVTVDNCSATGTVTISVATGSANSTTGDAALAAGPSTSYQVDNTGPNAPTGVTLGSVPTSLATSPTISYTAATDVGGATVASHQVQILRTSDSVVMAAWATHSSGGAIGGLTLAANTQYSAYVRAIDSVGNTGTSTAPANWTTPNCTAGSQVFAYTGGDQTFTVPSGCSQVSVKAWGAGGAAGGSWNNGGPVGGNGGGGAFVSSPIVATSGESLIVRVGGTGNTTGSGGFNGGGATSTANPSLGYGGGGGGGSFVLRSSTVLVASGGGGGGGVGGDGAGAGSGGAGGYLGLVGGKPAGGSSSFVAAGGGNSNIGGGAAGTSNYNGGSGTLNVGGAGPAGNSRSAGGGGGGYYGGGGGGAGVSGEGGAAGGGGSSYSIGASPTYTSGSGRNPGNTADSSYVSGVGVGGFGVNNGTVSVPGGNGLIVIFYSL